MCCLFLSISTSQMKESAWARLDYRVDALHIHSFWMMFACQCGKKSSLSATTPRGEHKIEFMLCSFHVLLFMPDYVVCCRRCWLSYSQLQHHSSSSSSSEQCEDRVECDVECFQNVDDCALQTSVVGRERRHRWVGKYIANKQLSKFVNSIRSPSDPASGAFSAANRWKINSFFQSTFLHLLTFFSFIFIIVQSIACSM